MAFDGLFLCVMKRELETELPSRVDKIFQPGREELVFCLRGKDSDRRLLISARPNAARIQFTDIPIENPSSPPMFCMLMRKRLSGARLSAIRQPGCERLLMLDFDTRNDFGDEVRLSVACEIMGRNSNIILIGEDGRIVDAVRRTDASNAVRIVMPGMPYTPPPVQDKLDFLNTGYEEMTRAVCASSCLDTDRALSERISGLSPGLCRILALASPIPPRDDPKQAESLINAMKLLRGEAIYGGKPVCYRAGEASDYSFVSPPGSEEVVYDSYSEMLDVWFGEREHRERMRSKTSALTRLVSNTLARTRRRIAGQERELEATSQRESLRIYGELLKANLHTLSPGDTVCRAVNFYSEELTQTDIPLDPSLSPAQNAQKYFRDYRKANTARAKLGGLIESGRDEITYLESVALELENAATDADIAEIREELTAAGYLRRPRTNGKQKKVSGGAPDSYVSSEGFRILAGRNNRQNDELTLKTAGGRDIWFHVKNIPGSHVIVFAENREIPPKTLDEAARIAAANSKAADGVPVAVDYLPAKRVKKPAGAAPGMVIYENYSTAYVTTDRAATDKLRKKVR